MQDLVRKARSAAERPALFDEGFRESVPMVKPVCLQSWAHVWTIVHPPGLAVAEADGRTWPELRRLSARWPRARLLDKYDPEHPPSSSRATTAQQRLPGRRSPCSKPKLEKLKARFGWTTEAWSRSPRTTCWPSHRSLASFRALKRTAQRANVSATGRRLSREDLGLHSRVLA